MIIHRNEKVDAGMTMHHCRVPSTVVHRWHSWNGSTRFMLVYYPAKTVTAGKSAAIASRQQGETNLLPYSRVHVMDRDFTTALIASSGRLITSSQRMICVGTQQF